MTLSSSARGHRDRCPGARRCGGGKDSKHKAFANSLNAICKDENAKLAKLKTPAVASQIPPT